MAVNYISSPVVVSVNANSIFSENDFFPENVGGQPDGLVDGLTGTGEVSKLEFRISPANPATHIVLASDFTFAGLTPSFEANEVLWPVSETPTDQYEYVHIKYYGANVETTNALGNSQLIIPPPGIEDIVILDSTNTTSYENGTTTTPPTDNEVIVQCKISDDYPIGTTNINLILDIDGDARLIPTPYEPNELIITCELEGANCNANIVSIYQNIYNGVDPNWGGGNFWEWEQIETNNPKIAKIKATGPPNNTDAPIRTFDSFTPFLIRPDDGYLVGRMFCELIDPSTAEPVDCGNQSRRPYLHRKSFFGGNNLADISFNMINNQTTNIAISLFEQDEAQAILDSYFQDYFSFVLIANEGNIQPGDELPELYMGPSIIDTDGDGVGSPILFSDGGQGPHEMSFFGRTIGCDNPNVITYTDNSASITQWASWDHNETYLYWETAQWIVPPLSNISNPITTTPLTLQMVNNQIAYNINNTYLNYFYQDQASFWGPRIDFIDTKQDSWPLLMSSLDVGGGNNVWSIYEAVNNAGGTFEALLAGNGVLIDLKGLDGWKNMNSDIREIKIKIEVNNPNLLEQDVDTATWTSSIMIDN
tara:strand:- start:22536 stop:24311 length:1776 start_codon:yes stop_codon:yes gene_type:complete